MFACKLPRANSEESEENLGDENQSENIDNLDIVVTFLGKYHNSKIIFSGMINEKELISIEERGHLNIWNIDTGKIVNSEILKFSPTYCALGIDKQHLIIGTKLSSIRIFKLDGSKSRDITETSAVKFNETQAVEFIKICSVFGYICVKFVEVNKLYFCSFNQKQSQIDLRGYLPIDIEIKDFEWIESQDQPNALILLKNGIAMSLNPNFDVNPDTERLTILTERIGGAVVRKIDPDSEKIIFHKSDNSFFCYGSNLVIRKYKIPTDSIFKLDIKSKYPLNPLEEFIGFDLMPQVIELVDQRFTYATENGEIGFYDQKSETGSTKPLLSLETKGANFMRFVAKDNIVVGAKDGSLFLVENISRYFVAPKTNSHMVFRENSLTHDSKEIYKINLDGITKSEAKSSQKDDINNQSYGNRKLDANDHNLDSGEESLRSKDRASQRRSKRANEKQPDANTESNQLSQPVKKRYSLRKSTNYYPQNVHIAELDYQKIITSAIQHAYEDQVPDVNSILYEHHLQQIKFEKENHRDHVLTTLKSYQEEYNTIKSLNQSLEKEFRLSNDELCIDVEKQQAYKKLAEEVTQEIKENACKETIFYQLLHTKIKNNTFQKMETNLKGMAGFSDKIGVFNFPTSKVSPKENKRLSKMILLRNMELREYEWHAEHPSTKLQQFNYCEEILDIKQPSFLVNGGHGKQKMVLTDFEQREKELKEYEEDKRKKKEMLQNATNNNATRRIELVNRRKKKKKNNMKGFSKQIAENKQVSQDNQQQAKLTRSSTRELSKPYTLLYSTLELTTRNKKITQIYFIKNIIRVMKDEFNLEFDTMFKMREKKLDLINEFIKKISVICEELKIEDQNIPLSQNIIEKLLNQRQKHTRLEAGRNLFRKVPIQRSPREARCRKEVG